MVASNTETHCNPLETLKLKTMKITAAMAKQSIKE